MDSVTIMRALWRRRRYVAGVFLLALLAGTAIMYKVPNFESRRYEVGVATAQILIDTPTSQVVEVAPRGSDTLGLRANLLASLMVDGDVKSDIARNAGLPPSRLGGVTEAATTSASSTASAAPVPSGPRAWVLTTQILTDTTGDQLPIIELTAQAPDSAGAARLASAAVTGLREYLDSTAASERIPDAQRLQVTGLGVPQVTSQTRGPSPILAIVAMIFVFGLGCSLVLGIPKLVRRWRAAAARERMEESGAVDERELSTPVEQAGGLLASVVGQDLDEDADGVFRIAWRVARDRVISTVDPDARRGHKTGARGFDGYKGHVAVDPDSELITATTVTAGNVGDGQAVDALLADELSEPDASVPREEQQPAAEEQPSDGRSTIAAEEPLAVCGDSAHGAGSVLDTLQNADAEIMCKVQPPNAPAGRYAKDAFGIDLDAGTVTCPAGQTDGPAASDQGRAHRPLRAGMPGMPAR
jgi:Transposase DDE domain